MLKISRQKEKWIIVFFFLTALFSPFLSSAQIVPKICWDRLEKYHDTLTEKEFWDAIEIYSQDGSIYHYLHVTSQYVDIFRNDQKTKPAVFRLFLAKNTSSKRTIRNFATKIEFLRGRSSARPLKGLKILLDPGHIGGAYAEMEERILRVENHEPIQEADLNLKTALLLKKRLTDLGARVYLTKENFEPVTHKRPKDFRKEAEKKICGSQISPVVGENLKWAIQKETERLFYRKAEIKARAERAKRIRPDFTLCLHFNAAPATPQNPWVEDNRLVIFTHGSYGASEVKEEEERFRLFSKLLEGSHKIELILSDAIAKKMAEDTKLPYVEYSPSPQYYRVNENPYLYARNLAANRLFPGPVIYLEPYYQNNILVRDRILAGDYEGEKTFQGRPYKSIFREYADSVADGILIFFSSPSLSPKKSLK
ncbi:MAG: N-acetylmuramoyl-L-alanine amidase [Chlamydiae bacterium]|nr:N-acetylmuramoyl-L-alanine amidase [Chlamydiota bacterium]MBI3266349.1 N-acetylmuramoyl-L-alanine amidase [Chlamydiota bacterium]